MAVVPVSYPGVYVLEQTSGSVSISPVATSRALFIGRTQRGPMSRPTAIRSFTQYEALFGSDTAIGEMNDQVRQFFLNGGGHAFVMRIPNGATALPAFVEVENEFGDPVWHFEAKDIGNFGNSLRIEIDYETSRPETTFNLTVYREVTGPGGALQPADLEVHRDLETDPTGSRYVVNVLASDSRVLGASPVTPTGAAPIVGVALSGALGVGANATAARTDFMAKVTTAITNAIALAGAGTTAGAFEISVDDQPFVRVALPATIANLAAIEARINAALAPLGPQVTIDDVNLGTATDQALAMRVTSNAPASARSSVRFRRAPGLDDIAREIQLGAEDGGLEIGGGAPLRPMPTGIVARLSPNAAGLASVGVLAELLRQLRTDVTGIALTDSGTLNVPLFGAGTLNRLYEAPVVGGVRSLAAGRQSIAEIVSALNGVFNGTAPRRWVATQSGFRVVLKSLLGTADTGPGTTLANSGGGAFDMTTAPRYLNAAARANVKAYRSCLPPTPFVANAQLGNDGGIPIVKDYDDAYPIVRREIDLFNLLILPRSAGQTDAMRTPLWGPASAFCKERRAVLLMDPFGQPAPGWGNVDQAKAAITGGLRIGIVRDHTAIYWPRIVITDPATGRDRAIDPSGSVAGVCARIDSTRGVWKAPAGLEAAVIGVRGVEVRMSDAENGAINPEAMNAIRAFPNGVVVWGARTMDGFDNSGNTDYRYLPIRRVALFIEESLYRGLTFAVFEPNDEPLWAQIRLAAGAFMNGLFREGAFAGRKSSDAYFVKCDEETTTQTDRNLGIVNVVVGFAPLRPAEFVVVIVKQLAGQVQT